MKLEVPRTWLCFSDRYVDARRIAAVEPGRFDEAHQEWTAVLVLDAGGRVELGEPVPRVLAKIEEAEAAHAPSLHTLLTSLTERRAIIAEHSNERELRRRCATSAPPPGDAPDLSRPMAYLDAVTLARQFLAFYEMPEAHSPTWRGAIAKTGLALAEELARLFAEPYQDGTPIAGAGCT